MDLTKVLAQLHVELANLDAAILSLEKLKKEGHRRGRPPKILAGMKGGGRPSRRGPGGGASQSTKGA